MVACRRGLRDHPGEQVGKIRLYSRYFPGVYIKMVENSVEKVENFPRFGEKSEEIRANGL